MCWCEQISPLAHSSQGTWQPFNVSHCIEMHNTLLLGRAGQLSQAYFTHSPPILTLRNLPPTVNKQWPPLWESLCHVTLASTPAEKRQLPRWTVYFLVQMQLTGRYDHRPESDFVFLLCRKCRNLIWNAIREFVTEKLIQLWWNPAAQGRPRMREASSVSCQVAT